MSLSWRDEIRVGLSPERVALARVARGWRRKVTAKQLSYVSASAASDWTACVDTLKRELQQPAWQNADATVVLSNHFVRYALVPWSEHLARDEEKLAWVEHHFAELYGEARAPAHYRWSEDRPDAVSLASAVDAQFVAEIGAAFSGTSARLRSVQPYLMAAFNHCRAHVKDASAWIVLPENGRVCMAAVVNGEWRSVTCKNIGENWQSELTRLLERQRVLADDVPAVVLAYSPELAHLNLDDAAGVPVRMLAPRALTGYSPHSDAEYSMALTGVA